MSQAGGPAEASTSELVGQFGEQITRLVREELQLARLEVTAKTRQVGIGAGLLGGGGLLALYGIAAVLAALVLGLALVMPAWVAALVVGAVLLAAAGVVAITGRNRVREATPPLPQEAAASVKTDVQEISRRARS